MNTKANTWTSDKSWRSVDYIASLLQWVWRNYVLIYQAHQCRRVNRSSIQSCCSTLLRLMSPWDFSPLSETATSSKVSNRYRMDSFHHRILILITPKWTDFFFSGKWSLGWVPNHWLRINKMLISITKNVHSH